MSPDGGYIGGATNRQKGEGSNRADSQGGSRYLASPEETQRAPISRDDLETEAENDPLCKFALQNYTNFTRAAPRPVSSGTTYNQLMDRVEGNDRRIYGTNPFAEDVQRYCR